MTEIEWLHSDHIDDLSRFVGAHNLTFRKSRLFQIACCRRVEHLVDDEEVLQLLGLAELFVDESAGLDALSYLHTQTRERLGRVIIDQPWHSPNSVATEAILLAADPNHDIQMNNQSDREPESAADFASLAVEFDGSVSHFTDEARHQIRLLHEIFGNPFRPVALDPRWQTSTVVELAHAIYKGFRRQAEGYVGMPILADALTDAGCDDEQIIQHCRCEGPHVKGCWVVDLILGKE